MSLSPINLGQQIMNLDDDYEEFYTLPDDWFQLEPTIEPEPNESSVSTIIPTVPPSPEENKCKKTETQTSSLLHLHATNYLPGLSPT